MGHLNSNLLWKKYAAPFFKNGMKILEIAPAGFPSYYQTALEKENIKCTYHTLDVRTEFISGAESNPNFILATDAYHYPIKDDCYDIVFSDQVLAHVPFFWDWYKELKRIVKPGGHVITINSQSYPSCPSPIDAWRVHSDGMLALNEYVGLDTIFSKTESAEAALHNIKLQTGYYFPGASILKPYNEEGNKVFQLNKIKRTWNSIVGKIPKLKTVLLNPVQLAFDTITIAQKNMERS